MVVGIIIIWHVLWSECVSIKLLVLDLPLSFQIGCHHLFSACHIPLSFLGWFCLKTEFDSDFALLAVESPTPRSISLKYLKSYVSNCHSHAFWGPVSSFKVPPWSFTWHSTVTLKQNKQLFSKLKTFLLPSRQEKGIKTKILFLLY